MQTAPLYRVARWKLFSLWYAGGEGQNLKPGFGTPSHARVLVSERWESRHAKLRRVLLRTKWEVDKAMDDDEDEEEEGSAFAAWAKKQSTAKDLIPKCYDSIVNTGQGRALRREMLQETLALVQVRRRALFVTLFWPLSILI